MKARHIAVLALLVVVAAAAATMIVVASAPGKPSKGPSADDGAPVLPGAVTSPAPAPAEATTSRVPAPRITRRTPRASRVPAEPLESVTPPVPQETEADKAAREAREKARKEFASLVAPLKLSEDQLQQARTLMPQFESILERAEAIKLGPADIQERLDRQRRENPSLSEEQLRAIREEMMRQLVAEVGPTIIGLIDEMSAALNQLRPILNAEQAQELDKQLATLERQKQQFVRGGVQ